jgi:uncharacterized protein (TIGR00255 family)
MHSMTGFGRGSSASDHGTATVEISCVNRKQAEIILIATRELSELEPQVRKILLGHISRGRVQVNVKYEPAATTSSPVSVDLRLCEGLAEAMQKISQHTGLPVKLEAADFLRLPGAVRVESSEVPLESAWEVIEPALHTALEQLMQMRRSEGADLVKDMLQRLEILEKTAASISAQAPGRPERYREMLLKRLREAKLELDLSDDRVVREIALFADRCDISEELTRLDSHFQKFRHYLLGQEAAGRSLDFLCQELHREFNTIGSKASDAAIAQAVVEAKTELEKIREQVQNIE